MTPSPGIIRTRVFIFYFTSSRTAISTYFITIIALVIDSLTITTDLCASIRNNLIISFTLASAIFWDEFIHLIADDAKLSAITESLNSCTSYYISTMKSCQMAIEAFTFIINWIIEKLCCIACNTW